MRGCGVARVRMCGCGNAMGGGMCGCGKANTFTYMYSRSVYWHVACVLLLLFSSYVSAQTPYAQIMQSLPARAALRYT